MSDPRIEKLKAEIADHAEGDYRRLKAQAEDMDRQVARLKYLD